MNVDYCRRMAKELGITAEHAGIGVEYATGLTYCACGAAFVTAWGIRRHIRSTESKGRS